MTELITYAEWIIAFVSGVLTGVFVTKEVLKSKSEQQFRHGVEH